MYLLSLFRTIFTNKSETLISYSKQRNARYNSKKNTYLQVFSVAIAIIEAESEKGFFLKLFFAAIAYLFIGSGRILQVR